jgi:uncharacterized protein (TIGR04255 family)
LYEPIPSPRYDRDPITEAVIDIHVAGEVEERQIEKVAQRLKKKYPNSQPLNELQFLLDATGEALAVEQEKRKRGLRLSTDDQSEVVLVKSGSLTTARLPPYPGWDTLFGNARDNWSVWRSATPAFGVSRIGVRYINRIDLPGGSIRLEDYLKFHPRVGEGILGPMMGYLMQATVPTYRPEWVARLTSTLITPPPVPDCNSVLLDIDVFRLGDLPRKEDELWAVVDEAHALKNDLFERCITDATRERFRR